MAGCIVQVWFEPENRITRGKFAIIETEAPDFATFCEWVEGNHLIGGAILWTRPSQGRMKFVTDRRPTAFRGSAVLRCQLPYWRFVEEGGEVE